MKKILTISSLALMLTHVFASNDLQTEVSRSLEKRATAALSRYIAPKDFEVIVTATPADKTLPRAGYDPEHSTPELFDNMPLPELHKFLSHVKVEVKLATAWDASTASIKFMLQKELQLDPKRGDAVVFSKLGLEAAPEEWVQEKTALKAELDLLKAELSKNRPEPKEDYVQKNLFLFYWILGVFLGAAVLFFLGMLSIGRSLGSIGRRVSQALGARETFTGVGHLSGGGSEQKINQKLEAKVSASGAGRLQGMGHEAIHRRLSDLRKELLEEINSEAESTIISHLISLLSTPEYVPKAIALLEVMGKEQATVFFQRLPMDAQEKLLGFLKDGAFEHVKLELMLTSVEEVKTLMLMQTFRQLKGASEKLSEKLVQLSKLDLLQLASDIDVKYLPRLFLYLNAETIATLLKQMRTVDTRKFKDAVSEIAKMTKVADPIAVDHEIVQVIERILERNRSDIHRPFLKMYQEIIERAGGEVGEEILSYLSSNPSLESFFKNNVITLKTFFQVNQNSQRELIAFLSNRELASFLNLFEADQRAVVLSLIPERRRPIIDEEIESLNSRDAHMVAQLSRNVRERAVAFLREKRERGGLELAAKEPLRLIPETNRKKVA